jgi:hypothetical protein
MDIEIFKMNRLQALYESAVDYNLSGAGLPPVAAEALLDDEAAWPKPWGIPPSTAPPNCARASHTSIPAAAPRT